MLGVRHLKQKKGICVWRAGNMPSRVFDFIELFRTGANTLWSVSPVDGFEDDICAEIYYAFMGLAKSDSSMSLSLSAELGERRDKVRVVKPNGRDVMSGNTGSMDHGPSLALRGQDFNAQIVAVNVRDAENEGLIGEVSYDAWLKICEVIYTKCSPDILTQMLNNAKCGSNSAKGRDLTLRPRVGTWLGLFTEVCFEKWSNLTSIWQIYFKWFETTN